MPRRRSSSRRRTRARGSSHRRSRRSKSRGRAHGRKRQREKSSSDIPKKDGGKKQDGKKKTKKAEKPEKADADEKAEKAEKPEKDEKPTEKPEKQPDKTETNEKTDKPEKADADKADKKSGKDKPDKAKDKKTKDGKGKDKGDEKNNKTKSKSQSKKDGGAKADAKKKAKAKKDKSSSYDSSYSSSSSSSDDEDPQQKQQQYLNAMSQWAMMQGMPSAMGTSQMGMAGYAQYAGGQYPGYGAAGYGYSDPYGRPYGSSMGEQVPSGCGYMPGAPPFPPPMSAAPGAPPPPPAPPPYMPGPMTEEERLADERDKARRRLEDETRLRNEELHRKADAEKAVASIRNATLALQNGQSDALDNLRKTLENLIQRELPKCESHAEDLKRDMHKAIQEASKRKEALRELKSMVRSGEEHIKATAELIRQNLALDKEKDREEMNDQLENAGLEAQGMSDRYQSFMEEHLKPIEELQSVTKGPALIDMRLIIAKVKKLGSELTQTATNAANVVREGKDKMARREMAVEQMQRIQETFALYDVDEDGFLSKQEVIQYAQGEFEFTIPEPCMDRLWRNLVPPGKAGIAFDCFQQMKVTIGAARVIEKERRKAPSTEVSATLN